MPDERRHESADLADFEVLDASDTLDGAPGDDPLDRGLAPPQRWSAAIRHSPTAVGDGTAESLDQLLAAEVPDVGTGPGADDPELGWDENATDDEIARLALDDGSDPRSGRLIATDNGPDIPVDADLVAYDAGIDGGGATAEEAAMHMVGEEDSQSADAGCSRHTERRQARAAAGNWRVSGVEMFTAPVVTPDDHVLGPADAPVTVVEYGDYECPYCRGAARDVHRLLDRYPGRIRFVFRNFPIPQLHPHAEQAAEAAEAAAAQGKFWPMYELLLRPSASLDLDSLLGYADRLGLDTGRFENELRGSVYAARVDQDVREGVRNGVNATPKFYVDGMRIDGKVPLEGLVDEVQKVVTQAGE